MRATKEDTEAELEAARADLKEVKSYRKETIKGLDTHEIYCALLHRIMQFMMLVG